MAEVKEDLFCKLPEEILVMILQRLPVVDLLKCMQLCKRFKSVMGPQEFWKNYIQKNYKFEQVNEGNAQHEFTEPNLDILAKEWYCFWDNSNEMPPANDASRYVFRPFPQMWDNGIITPDKFAPFSEENNYDYSSLNKALYLLLQLRQKCEEFQVSSCPYYSTMDSSLDVCLFAWSEKELPEPAQVLSIFNVHEEIIRQRSESKEEVHLSEKLEYKLEEYSDTEDIDYDRHITLLNNTFSKISENEDRQEELFKWLQNLFQPSLMFCAGKDAIHPQLYFHLTLLSPGWVGGVFATIGLV